jgi:hypothetical protein
MANNKPLLTSLLTALAISWLADAQPARMVAPGGPIPIDILAQSPAETQTDLQAICLFRSSIANTLHGSLVELNEKLKGLLDRVRQAELFRGELGETVLIAPPNRSSGAKRLLIIGLGDAETFSPQRMELVGEVLYVEASRLGVAHPFFAPTILDGGVTTFTTGEVAEQVINGFLRAVKTDKVLRDAHSNVGQAVSGLTYLAGFKNVESTREGIERAVSGASRK